VIERRSRMIWKNDLNPMKEKVGSFDGALQLQIQWLKCGADSEITREL
jgi:hypothetical protein